jgi:peptidoglycan/LPS O-acetylase OafA/YrhL
LTESLDINILKKLYGLDHLRALAIFSVFLFHYAILNGSTPLWLASHSRFGWTGVDLFFVLSGFLISSQLFSQLKKGQSISIKDFYLKRFFRIFPAFWVTIAIYFCVPFFHEKETLPPIWRFLTFTQNLGLDTNVYGTFSHAWSLCVEEHFYLFLPLILILLQSANAVKKSYRLIITLFMLGIIIRFYCYDHLYLPKSEDETGWMFWYKYIYYPTYNRLDGLLAGVSIAGISHFLPRIWDKISKYGNLFFVFSLIPLGAAYFICKDEESFISSIFGFPLIAFGYGLLVVAAISPTSFLFKFQSRFTTLVATLSYSVYLTHKGIIHITNELLSGFNLNGNLMFLICILTCLLGAFLLNLAIEKPFMKLRDRFVKAK